MLPFPSDLRLPLIDVAKLEPDPADVELMRQSLGTPLVDDWWQAADELGICGALGALDRDRGSGCGNVGGRLRSINLAFDEVMAEAFHADEVG